MIDPLADPSRTCAGCHDEDALARSKRYTDLPPAPPPASPRPQAVVVNGHGSPVDRALAALSIALSLALALALRPRRPWSALTAIRARAWSPYAAGALLGAVVAVSEIVYGRPVAVSGAVDRLAAYVARAFFPTLQYYTLVLRPQITPQVWSLIGIVVGAYASAAASGQARLRQFPDTQWLERFGPSRAKRVAVAFIGAALVQLGAGIAGGCTSGLAISAGAALVPGAFLFMAGMFAGGIPTAFWLYRKETRTP